MSQHASARERVEILEIKPGAIDVTEEEERVIFTVTDKESSFRIDPERNRFVCMCTASFNLCNVTLEWNVERGYSLFSLTFERKLPDQLSMSREKFSPNQQPGSFWILVARGLTCD